MSRQQLRAVVHNQTGADDDTSSILAAVNAAERPDPHALQPGIPLCVDLDGTLIRSDLLVESALGLLSLWNNSRVAWRLMITAIARYPLVSLAGGRPG